MFLLQVLHVCRQSVLSKVRLTPLTDEIPTVNFYLTLIVSEVDRTHLGQRQAVMALMILGYRCAAEALAI